VKRTPQAVPAEPPQLPREYNQGRDELNLAEFPLAALSSRVSPAKKTVLPQPELEFAFAGISGNTLAEDIP